MCFARCMERRTLSVEQVAARLNISTKTVRRMIERGALPGAFRVGRNIRCDSEVLEAEIATAQAAVAVVS